MARAIRVEYEGASYHVCARGQRREAIYQSEDDRKIFLEILGQAVKGYGLRVHGYCLMVNHYHLLVTTPYGNLSRAMGWMQGTYGQKFNWRNCLVGHVFQGRYKAQIVDTDAYARTLLSYVHLNPARIGVKKGDPLPQERWEELRKYRWSSHRTYGGWEKGAEWLDFSWQHYYGRNPAEARRTYRREIRKAFAQGVESPWEGISQGLVLGGEELLEKVRALLSGESKKAEMEWVNDHQLERRRQKVRKLIRGETEQKVQVWLRVKLAQEPMAAVG